MVGLMKQQHPARIGININGLGPALHALSVMGFSGAECLQDTGISSGMLGADNVNFTLEQEYIFYRNILKITDNPLIGLDLGRAYRSESYGLLGYAMLTAKTVGEAFELAEQFFSLTFSHFNMSLVREGELAGISYAQEYDIAPDLLQVYVDRDLEAVASGFLATFQKRPEIESIRLMHNDVAQRGRYEQHFGCPVTFGHRRSEMLFHASLFDLALPQSHQQTSILLREQCQKLIAKLSRSSGLVEEVRNILVSSPGRFLSCDEVAAQLGFNVRTLRRKLSREGHSYQSVLNEIRHELAKEYLRSRMSIESIADKLGYSEPASFSNAFKRWENQSPSYYRQQFS